LRGAFRPPPVLLIGKPTERTGQFERTLDGPDLEWRARMNLDLLPKETRSAQATLKEYYSREGFIPVRGTDLMILDLGH
jgi:hypothetical protein